MLKGINLYIQIYCSFEIRIIEWKNASLSCWKRNVLCVFISHKQNDDCIVSASIRSAFIRLISIKHSIENMILFKYFTLKRDHRDQIARFFSLRPISMHSHCTFMYTSDFVIVVVVIVDLFYFFLFWIVDSSIIAVQSSRRILNGQLTRKPNAIHYLMTHIFQMDFFYILIKCE